MRRALVVRIYQNNRLLRKYLIISIISIISIKKTHAHPLFHDFSRLFSKKSRSFYVI